MKIWTSNEKGNERIIAFIDNTIYRGNPKASEVDAYVLNLKMKQIPTGNFVGIPLRYVREINLQDGKEYIEILFGTESYEHFRIKDSKVRNDIFEYFKATIPNISESVDRHTAFQAGKKPLIASALVAVLFVWALYLAIQIEHGNDYDVVDGHYNSITGIVLAIAYLGMTKVMLIFGSLLAIGLFSFFKKAKNPPVITRLAIRR